LYIIDQIQKTIPVTYKLKDLLGDEIKGSFYNEELQKSTQEVYRVEKVIRKKKINGVEHALVKWSGYNEKHNSWLSVKELEKLN
jgi:Chromo (CHRromatin Organisation MOdifier) domain